MRASNIPDLAAIRKTRGISLEEIAQSTKIRGYYLQAIEDGALGRLPGGILTKSYVRQYARAIDYDEEILLDKYDILSDDPPREEPRPAWLERLIRLVDFAVHYSARSVRRAG